jgi:hypothetical protein
MLFISVNGAGLGACAIGIVVAYISMMFITRAVETDSTAKNLAAFIGVLLGGTAVAFLTNKIGADSNQFGEYGIGLAIGLGLYVIVYWIQHGHGPTRQSTRTV